MKRSISESIILFTCAGRDVINKGTMARTLILLVTCMLFASSFAFSDNGSEQIEVKRNSVTIKVNGETVEVDNLLYNSSTYAPIRIIIEKLGDNISWDGETRTVIIDDESHLKDLSLHGFYAIKSWDQFQSFKSSRSLSQFEDMSFAWSRIEFDETTSQIALNYTTKNSNDFYIPSSYGELSEELVNQSIEGNLNVFAAKNLPSILADKDRTVEVITDLIIKENQYNSKFKFSGVTINFEGLKEEDSDKFIAFLNQLKEALAKENKRLYVTVGPNAYNDAYDYSAIGAVADKVILMAHDYDAKSIKEGTVSVDRIYTPLTPINSVESALKKITDPITGIKDSSKIMLQISFGSAQWKTLDGKLYGSTTPEDGIYKADRPTYDMIYDRVLKEIAKGKSVDEFIFFDQLSQNPYIKYKNETDGTMNFIWYEDARSVKAKVKLASAYNLGGVSLWRLGSVPEFYDPKGHKLYFDVWQELL